MIKEAVLTWSVFVTDGQMICAEKRPEA